MASRYTVETNGDIALSAATAKTILNYIAASGSVGRGIELSLSFDGTSGTAVPVLVELCKSSQGGAGTSTSHTMAQSGGPTRTVQGTAARNYTAEPTTLTTLKRWRVHPQTGITLQWPLGREPEQVTSANGLCVRVTAAASVNVQGHLEVEEG